MKDKDKDLNVKGAYLHMAADALVSVGVVVSGIIITYTGWSIIDPIIGLGIAVIIIVSTWGLLHDSLRLSLDGVPVGIDAQKIQQLIMEQPGVENCHHLHIWALSTTETALTAHIVIDNITQLEEVKHHIKERLVSLRARRYGFYLILTTFVAASSSFVFKLQSGMMNACLFECFLYMMFHFLQLCDIINDNVGSQSGFRCA